MATRQSVLNKLAPGAKKAKMGDVLADLIAQVNALTTGHNALVAKLDADAGVTDTNYTSLTGVSATPIKTLEQR
jgi:hypothetical protein